MDYPLASPWGQSIALALQGVSGYSCVTAFFNLMRTKFRRLITKNVLFQRSIKRGLSDAGSDERIRFDRSGAFCFLGFF